MPISSLGGRAPCPGGAPASANEKRNTLRVPTVSSPVAYGLINRTEMPSWGYMVEHSATTIWQRWDGWAEGRGFQNPGMNSFNHYAIGAVGEGISSIPIMV